MPDLNQSQIQARDHIGSNLLILAGAGAGKTETISARALNLAGLQGSTGLTLITFTKKAALSLRERFEQVQGTNHNAFIGTFHSLCWRIILEFGYKLGIDSSWAIMDQDDAIRLMKMYCATLDANECLKVLSFSRNSNISVNDAINTPRFANLQGNEDLIIRAAETYSQKTKNAGRCRREKNESDIFSKKTKNMREDAERTKIESDIFSKSNKKLRKAAERTEIDSDIFSKKGIKVVHRNYVGRVR